MILNSQSNITNHIYDAVIIGGGPAGLMSAITASLLGKKVVVIEKNKLPARKLLITGKGRCNLTNNSNISNIIKNINTNSKFMYSCLTQFSPEDLMHFFENLNVPLKTERGNRVFPKSDKALDIVNALIKKLNLLGIRIISATVKDIYFNTGYFNIITNLTNQIYKAPSIILSTGGVSYPRTGSTGDGYVLAQKFKHKIIDPKPSLVPIHVKEPYVKDMQGLSLKNIVLNVIELTDDNDVKPKIIFNKLGEVLLTHFGLSGPLILKSSALIKHNKKYLFKIDLKPSLSIQQLDKRILKDFYKNLNRDMINSLSELLPKKLIPVVLKISQIDYNLKVNQLSKELRHRLCYNIKNLTFHFEKLRSIDEAVITSGGVDIKDINPKTMESKLKPNLFFAGEIIDVDALTGGYNLQIAFSTGYVAGVNC